MKYTFEDVPRVLEILEQKLTTIVEQQATNPSANVVPWMNVDELSLYLPDHPARQTIYNWVYHNLIPSYKRGKCLYFRKSEIDQWLENGGII